MRYLITLFCYHCVILSAYSTDTVLTITCHISSLPDSKVFLASVRGDAYKIIDTAELKNGVCIFSFPDNTQTGMYKIIPETSLSQSRRNVPLKSLDVIFNSENISLKTVYPWLQDSLVILESKENKLYYDFLKQENAMQKKLELLQPLLAQYPYDDDFYGSVIKRYNSLQKDKNSLIQQTCTDHKGSIAASLIAMQKSPFLDANLPETERQAFYKQHYFDELDYSDENLIYSNAYTRSLIKYIMLCRDAKLSQAELEKEFMRAVDVILSRINKNPEVYDFLLNYLMEGFELLKLENVLKYIADNYMNTVCKTENSTTLQRRMEAYSKFTVGQMAPDITIPDRQNQEIKLSAINSSFTLVVFWASWCPGCEELLPKLKKWYVSKAIDLEIVAVSLDTIGSDWKEAIEKNNYIFLNGCDLKGWNGKAARDYYLYATPTMFLLDRNRKILAKPLSFDDLLRAISSLVK
jgi:thiol-disulfide isomerase/thioredoxin